MIYKSIEELIGNTPLLLIDPKVHGVPGVRLYAKLEFCNPFGSVKDRVALGLLAPHLEELKKSGKTVVESSSGNTAKALAALAGIHGLTFKAVTNRIRYQEIRQTLQLLDAQLEELPGLSDCSDPFDPNDAIQYSRELVTKQPDRYHLTDQYYSEDNANAHYRTTARELVSDLRTVDYLFGFLGTCGSTLGTGRFLREQNSQTQVVGIVGEPGHNIPGGRNFEELYEVGLFQRDFYNDIVSGTTQQAIDGMLTLNRRCGVLCGPSTGLIYAKAVEKLTAVMNDRSVDAAPLTAVFFACDRVEPYLGFLQKQRPELFSGTTVSRPTVRSLSPEDLSGEEELSAQDALSFLARETPLVIDIRGHFAFSLGHIPGAMNILDELLAQMVESGQVFPKEKPILVVCRIGDSSRRFAVFLRRQGYHAFSLQGGMQALKKLKPTLHRAETQAPAMLGATA